MKALVALLSVAVVSSTHVLEKRSLLGVGQDHKHHHEHERTGRDSPVSAPAGYLPPAEDDYADYDDESAGFGTGKGDSADNSARGFGQQGQDNEDPQSQYGQNERRSQSGGIRSSVSGQSAKGRNQQDGNQRVKFGQRINQNIENNGLIKQQSSSRNQQQAGRRNQQKGQRQNQFGPGTDEDDALGTYGNDQEQEQSLNNQQQSRQEGGSRSQFKQGSNQRTPGKNSEVDISGDQSQYAQQTGGDDRDNDFNRQKGQFGLQGQQNEDRQVGVQSNQERQHGEGNSVQSDGQGNQSGQEQGDTVIASYGAQGQGQQGGLLRSRQSGQFGGQFGQGGNDQQFEQNGRTSNRGNKDRANDFGNEEEQGQSAVEGYGAPAQGQQNIKSQIGQNKRGQHQKGQIHQGQNKRGQNQIGQNKRGQNQRGQNQRGKNKRGQNQTVQNQGGRNQRGQNQRSQNQNGQNRSGQNQGGSSQVQNQAADDSYGAPGKGQDNNNFQTGQTQRVQNQQGHNHRGQSQIGQNLRGQTQSGQNKRGQNRSGFSQGKNLRKQVQEHSAEESYGAPGQGQDNNKFQNQQGQDQRGQNQRGQNQRAAPSHFDSSAATINRFLPSSQDNQIINSGYGAPQGSQSGQKTGRDQTGRDQTGRDQTGRDQTGRDQTGRDQTGRDQNGSRRNSNTGNSFAAQGVQPGTGTNGFPFSSTGSNGLEDNFKLADTLICPGGTIESCIKVCPGNTALLYGGCVQGCAERCDGQGGQAGQQEIPGQNVQLSQEGQPIIAGQSNQQGQPDQSQGQYGQQTA